jgi:hypothetical protein
VPPPVAAARFKIKTAHHISLRGGKFEVLQLSGRTSIALMECCASGGDRVDHVSEIEEYLCGNVAVAAIGPWISWGPRRWRHTGWKPVKRSG